MRHVAARTPGFLPEGEAEALFGAALAAPEGPLLEVGSYCGRSAIWLGAAARARGSVLFTIDHHRGSEEHQPGEPYHDPSLLDPRGRFDSLPRLRATLEDSGLEENVVVVVGRSSLVAAQWATPLALAFVDGGHSREAAFADYVGWAPHVMAGGRLAIHDVFPDPADGGRPPYEVYLRALADGFEEIAAEGSLRVLRRPSPG